MKRLAILLSLSLALAVSALQVSAQAQPAALSEADRAAVSVPLETYVKAQANGDGALLLTAFHKDAKLIGADKSGMITLTIQQYARSFSGKPADDEVQRKRSYEILHMANDAAIALVILDYPKVKYTDYMNLIKIKGEWKIVHKSFYAERR
jgi:Putative lumazine-binding